MKLNIQFLRNIAGEFLVRYDYDGFIFWLMPRWGIWWTGDTPNRYQVRGSPEDFILSRKIADLSLWKDKWSLLAVVLTSQCNGRCAYCYADEVRKAVPTDTINDDEIVRWVSREGYDILQWFGGEPVLEIDRICSYPVSLSVKAIEVVTGLKVSDSQFEKLLSYVEGDNRVFLTVSCDSLSDLGTWMRGSADDYRDLLDKIEIIAKRVGVSRFSVRSTLTRYGHNLSGMLQDICGRVGEQPYWGMGVVHGAGRSGFWLLPEQKSQVSSFILRYVNSILEGVSFVVPNPISSVYKFYLSQLNAQSSDDAGLVWMSMGLCGFSGRGGKTIRWDGEQCVCPEEATKILSSGEIAQKLSAGLFIFTECLGCEWLVSCGGLCLWNRPAENSEWCWLRQLSIVHGFALAFVKSKLLKQPDDGNIVLTCG